MQGIWGVGEIDLSLGLHQECNQTDLFEHGYELDCGLELSRDHPKKLLVESQILCWVNWYHFDDYNQGLLRLPRRFPSSVEKRWFHWSQF